MKNAKYNNRHLLGDGSEKQILISLFLVHIQNRSIPVSDLNRNTQIIFFL